MEVNPHDQLDHLSSSAAANNITSNAPANSTTPASRRVTRSSQRLIKQQDEQQNEKQDEQHSAPAPHISALLTPSSTSTLPPGAKRSRKSFVAAEDPLPTPPASLPDHRPIVGRRRSSRFGLPTPSSVTTNDIPSTSQESPTRGIRSRRRNPPADPKGKGKQRAVSSSPPHQADEEEEPLTELESSVEEDAAVESSDQESKPPRKRTRQAASTRQPRGAEVATRKKRMSASGISPPTSGASKKGKSKTVKQKAGGRRASGKKGWQDEEDHPVTVEDNSVAPTRPTRKGKAADGMESSRRASTGRMTRQSKSGPEPPPSSPPVGMADLASSDEDDEDVEMEDPDDGQQPVNEEPAAATAANAEPGAASSSGSNIRSSLFGGLTGELPPGLRAAARGLMGDMFGDYGFGGYSDIGTGLDSLDGMSAFGATPRQAAEILKKSLPALRSPSVVIRKNALSQVAELLISQPEDILASYFAVDSYVTEFVAILSGKPNIQKKDEKKKKIKTRAAAADDSDQEEDSQPCDLPYNEDDEMARVLAMSAADAGVQVEPTGDFGVTRDEVEAQMFAARCMANMMETLPGSSHTIIAKGGVPVLCAKLMEIDYMDLAGQVLCTLEKLSKECAGQIVRAGGLYAMLQYLDFHDMNDQQTALQAAANCCRSISVEHFDKVQEVMPIIRGVLGWSTQKQVDPAALILIRMLDSYRPRPDLLEKLLDAETVKVVNALFLPGSGSSLLKASTYTSLLRSIMASAKVSPKVANTLFEADVATSMYFILTGLLPPVVQDGDDADISSHLPEGVVAQNLAQNPKEQIEEALTLICELLPPLSREGIFDPRMYSDKVHARYVKAKGKLEKHGKAGPESLAELEELVATMKTQTTTSDKGADTSAAAATETLGISAAAVASINRAKKELERAQEERIEQLRANPSRVNLFIRLMMPVLVELYSASPATRLRSKVLNGLVKAIAFSDGDQLTLALKAVPLASFLGSILSTRDSPAFVLTSLQIVELLLNKMSSVYLKSFQREGVIFEVCKIAEDELTPAFFKSRQPPAEVDEVDVKKEPEEEGTPVTMPSQPSLSVAATRRTAIVVSMDDDRKPASETLPELAMLRTSVLASTAPKRISSTPTDPHDINILRARILRLKKGLDVEAHPGETAEGLDHIRQLVLVLKDPSCTEERLRDALRQIASLFQVQEDGEQLSSFELLQSGLLQGLLSFVTSDGEVTCPQRRRLLFEVFTEAQPNGNASSLALLLKRLHESLSKLETFEVESASGALDDSKRSSLANLARALRIRLVAEPGTDVPKDFQNLSRILLPMSALHGGLGSGASGRSMSSMLAAAYAAGLMPDRESLVAARAAAGASSSLAQALLRAEDPKSAGPSDASTSGQPSRIADCQTSDSEGKDKEASKDAGAPMIEDKPVGLVEEAFDEDMDGGDEDLEDDDEDDEDDGDDFGDDGYGEHEMYDDGMDEELERPAKTVDLAVTEEGGKLEAKTPDGTRVATPTPTTSAAEASRAGDLPPVVGSYAAALKATPTDWHFSFSIGDVTLSNSETVYGAIHRSQTPPRTGQPKPPLWQLVPTVKYKKVEGPAPVASCEVVEVDEVEPASASALPSSLAIETSQATILRMMRVIHALNAEYADKPRAEPSRILGESAFVNNKLTAKFIRQLDELIIVASDCLPDWAHDLPVTFPFLFPFDARYTFLQSTAFGYARLIHKWLAHQNLNDTSRRSGALDTLPRLVRARVRISRASILESAVKVMELYGASAGILEIEYFDEVGTGLGPTLEFYSLASRAFARRSLGLWRDEDETMGGEHVHHPHGLFPRPISEEEGGEAAAQIISYFKTIGTFVGKALLDSRIIDCNFNKVFMKAVLGQSYDLTVDTLSLVDEAQARSLRKLQEYAEEKRACIESERLMYEEEGIPQIDIGDVEQLGLDFTLPGYPSIELIENGTNVEVTASNIDLYINKVVEYFLVKGISKQVMAFKTGFSTIFPVNDMCIFTPDELVLLFGDPAEDWSAETLKDAITADHGFSMDAPTVRNLVDIMSSYNHTERRDFLQFVTGAPKLPIGGFRALHPKFTVVKKTPEVATRDEIQLTPDQILPSVMTCASYLKLPDYSTKEILAARMHQAMTEGAGAFHMS